MTLPMVCRCCLGEDAPCRGLFSIYEWMGDKEVYTDMLMESFNIALQASECAEAGICEGCVLRLRDATGFKRQVLRLEGQFRQRIVTVKEESEEGLKKESDCENAYDNSDRDDAIEDDDKEDVRDFLPLSTFVKKSSRSSKRTSKSVKVLGVKKIKIKDEPGPSRMQDKNSITVKKGPPLLTIKPMKRGCANICEKIIKSTVTSTQRDIFSKLKNIPDRLKLKVNVAAIIKFSNATPFRDKKLKGSLCYFCPEIFTDPEALRQHCKSKHERDRDLFVSSITPDRCHIKVDIKDLKCTLCQQDTPGLPSLKRHLTTAHRKRIFDDVGDLILPFKLSNDIPLHCVVCNEPFEVFKTLHQHMNTHYRNHVCKVCDAGFVTLKRFQSHVRLHKDNQLPCQLCDKKFASNEKLKNHVRQVHMGLGKKHYCPQCGDTFVTHLQRQRHLTEAHDAKPIIYKCKACDRTFDAKKKLTFHTNKYHLLIKDQHCEQCDKSFYGRDELRDHMAVHATEKVYGCEMCNRSYTRKKTLREHMRIHYNDRRFACRACGQSFVQKCSWKSHVNSKHPDVPEEDLFVFVGKAANATSVST